MRDHIAMSPFYFKKLCKIYNPKKTKKYGYF